MYTTKANLKLDLWSYLIFNLETLSLVQLNKLLNELQLQWLTDILAHKFPLRSPEELREILLQEYQL